MVKRKCFLCSIMLEWHVKHAYFSSSGCQLLSQGFQFLLLNKQLLIVSLSQRLQGKNPLKTTCIPRRNFKTSKAQFAHSELATQTNLLNMAERTGTRSPPAACFCRSWAVWRAVWSLHQSFSWGEHSPAWVSPALPPSLTQSCWIWIPAWWRGSL